MPFNVQYLGEMQRVQRVEAHVSTWQQSDGSQVLAWSVFAYPSQDRSAKVLVDNGGALRAPSVEELYEPEMEAGMTQLIYDGTTVYELTLLGIGGCRATLTIMGELEGSRTGLVTLKTVTASVNAYAPAKKKKNDDIPLPSSDAEAAEIFFQEIRARRRTASVGPVESA